MSLLATYLNDHLLGATAGRGLSRRSASSNRDSAYGPTLARIAEEIGEDRETLLAIMDTLGVRVDHTKVIAGWSAEKLGRLKPNGRLLSYSPLSRVVELEALMLGVTGKLNLWRTLRETRGGDERLERFGLAQLERRAAAQQEQLEALLAEAASEAFT